MKKRMTLDFDQGGFDLLEKLAEKKGSTKADVVRYAIALLDYAMDSEDKTVTLLKDGKEIKVRVI